MLRRFTLFIIILCSFASFIYAQDYYADLTVNVDSSGLVSIDGSTNYVNLTVKESSDFTSKKGKEWLLNISRKEVFSDYVFTVNLPSSASVNYIKSYGNFRIEPNANGLLIKGFAEDKPLQIILQYELNKKTSSSFNFSYITYSLIILLFIIIIFLLVHLSSQDKINHASDIDLSLLSDRQKDIVKILIDEKKPLTQSFLQSKLGIPKASLSRNIQSLELKGIIEKESAGMTNLLRLKKK